MTTLTLRYIKGDFVVTGSDIEPLRFKTRREAEAIANSEPYIAHGVRRLKLVPWQLIAGR
jgi:uncharacterized protein YciI